MWAAGIAAGAAAVVFWRIVGPGYTWLCGATVSAVAAGAWFFEPHPLLAVGAVAGVVSIVTARSAQMAGGSLAVATAALLGFAASAGSPILALSGSLALGGITAEMLLGHWYLVSPQMPRWALRRLDVAGAAGVVVDFVVIVILGASLAGTGGLVFAGLGGFSLLLMVAVWYSLKEPSYPGVMAATGLSYLAVLTSLGAVTVGRLLLDGSSTFLG